MLWSIVLGFAFTVTDCAEIMRNETRWKMSNSHSNLAFDKIKFTFVTSSLPTCLSLCSHDEEWDACTFNNVSKQCHALDYDDKGNSVIESGTRLWIREGSCRPNFVKVSGFYQCIQYFDSELTWDSAKTECENLNGHLLIVDTNDKLNGIIDFTAGLPGVANEIYIGGSKDDGDGIYKWIDGRPISYPLTDNGDCVKFDTRYNLMMKHTCDHNHQYISPAELFNISTSTTFVLLLLFIVAV